MLDVNSGTSWLSGQNDGQADHPQRAHHRAAEAAEAADHHDGDQPQRVLDEEVAAPTART